MKKIVLIMMTCAMLLLAGCDTTEPVQEKTIGTVAEYEDYKAELLEAEFYTDDGKEMMKVNVTYTNDGVNGMYMLESFAVKAFQNDIELTDCTDINDDSKLITEVKDGQSITGAYIFELADTSTVEVRICTPTADEEILALKEYSND